MEALRGLTQHRALIVAAVVFAVGCGLLIQTVVSRLAPPVQPAVTSDAPDEAFDAPYFDEAVEHAADPPEGTPEAADVIAYVSGAVRAPDVYRLPGGARVKDLVVAAGGLRDDADIERINLAAPVTDGAHISVPWIGMSDEGAADVGAQATDRGDGLLDLNRATAAELDALPGIGVTLAGRIVARREQGGPFQSVDDLRDVEGIGPSLLAKIAPLVTVNP